ncbi:MAG: TonB-dependent receptor [Pseudomonadota bacterium]
MRVPKPGYYFCFGLLATTVSMPHIQAAEDRVLEEVIVSAQKRDQSAQDVPIAIAAFNEEQLKQLGTSRLDELAAFVTGAELFDNRGAGQPTWVIRGVGLADFNANNAPTAAIYYDELYLASNVMGGIGLFDVAQVEVLKGPQGGLYGRNTSGGAVRVLSRRAEVGEDFNGYITGSYGRWDRTTFEGALGGELTENSAFRIAAMTDRNGGWQDSLATPGNDEHGDRDFSAVRAQLLFQPTDNVDLWLKVDGGEDKSETTLGFARGAYEGLAGDFCPSAYAGSYNNQECLTWSNITNLFALTPGDPGLLPGGQEEDGTKVISKPINQLDNRWFVAELQVDWDLDFAVFTSISGYIDFDNKQIYDFDATPLTLFEEDGRAELTSWSQEFRLTSSSTGPFTWLGGISYAKDEDDEDRTGDLTDNVLILPSVIRRKFEQTAETWALFAEAEYALTSQWVLNGSLRYTDQSMELRNASIQDITNDIFFFEDVRQDLDLDNPWSGHIGINYLPTEDAMIYGRVTRGFKTGGFFGGFATTPDELRPYSEEKVTSYEIGFKSAWLSGSMQLNGAAYFYDYEDVQGFTQFVNETTGTVVTQLGNLGDAEHKGAELDILWLPAPIEGLSLSASAAWLDAKISDSDTIATAQTGEEVPIEGRKRDFAPEWSVAAQARYEWDIANLLAAVQINYSWRDDLTDRKSTLSEVDLAAFSQYEYGLLNARLSLADIGAGWELALIGRNITEEEYWSIASGDDLASYNSVAGQPRSWAVEASYQW